MMINSSLDSAGVNLGANGQKPKLLFIRPIAPNHAKFIRYHLYEQVKCLSHFFEVIQVFDDRCDYKRLCEIHRPDLSVFESGVYVSLDKRRTINNIDAYPEIPKVGLCNADAYCQTRKVFLSDMYRWGINTFFTISVSMAEYTPEIAERLYVWPNFADGDLYKDYGEHKHIPVLFTGSRASHYPWRNRIYKQVSPFYPSLLCPHFGWGEDRNTSRTISGESYARLLNASHIVPSCGTIANDVVRKHFEIPASKSCLLAPRTAALEAAGFKNMHNCMFADEHDVLDVLDYLFARPAELQAITEEGYKLVRSKHLLANRDQIYQWFMLQRGLAADQKIVQQGPFRSLVAVPKKSTIKNSHVTVNGVDRELLQLGDEKIEARKYSEAKHLFLRCLNYHSMAEPCIRLALTCLLEGDSEGAHSWCSKQIKVSLGQYNDLTPDPVEWAVSILIELCRGRESKALELADMFNGVRHPELDRVRLVAAVAAGRDHGTPAKNDCKFHHSIHELPETSFHDWLSRICQMLQACGQRRTAERVRSSMDVLLQAQQARLQDSSVGCTPVEPQMRADRSASFLLQREHIAGRLRAILDPGKALARQCIHVVERLFGLSLPYRLSRLRRQALYRSLEEVCKKEDIAEVRLCCAGNRHVIDACVLGASLNPAGPLVCCITSTESDYARVQLQYANHGVKVVRAGAIENGRTDKESKKLVVIDGSVMMHEAEYEGEIDGAALVVLCEINRTAACGVHQALIARPKYLLCVHDPEGAGFSIFRQLDDGQLPKDQYPVSYESNIKHDSRATGMALVADRTCQSCD